MAKKINRRGRGGSQRVVVPLSRPSALYAVFRIVLENNKKCPGNSTKPISSSWIGGQSDRDRVGLQREIPETLNWLLILPKSLHLSSRCLSGILSGSVSFYHEFHKWADDTNLFWFNIREIRLFVISTSQIHRGHDLSTRCLHSAELPKIPNICIYHQNAFKVSLQYYSELL